MNMNEVALHEAAHAVMAYHLGFTLVEVSVPSDGSPSHTLYAVPDCSLDDPDDMGVLTQVSTILAHPAIERTIECCLGDEGHDEEVRDLVRTLIAACDNERFARFVDLGVFVHIARAKIMVAMAGQAFESIVATRTEPTWDGISRTDYALVTEIFQMLARTTKEVAISRHPDLVMQESPFYGTAFLKDVWLHTRFELCKPRPRAAVHTLAETLTERSLLTGNEAAEIIRSASYNRREDQAGLIE